jgi:hypothetical protein
VELPFLSVAVEICPAASIWLITETTRPRESLESLDEAKARAHPLRFYLVFPKFEEAHFSDSLGS